MRNSSTRLRPAAFRRSGPVSRLRAGRRASRRNACRFVAVGLQVGRRDLDPEVPLAVLAGPEVADQREQGTHLTAEIREVGRAHARRAVALRQLLHRCKLFFQYRRHTTNPAIDRPFRNLRGLGRLQVRADRHAGGQPPRRRADHHEVVVAARGLRRDADLARRTAQLRREQPDDVEVPVLQREHFEPLRVARVGELDLGAFGLPPAIPEHRLHVLGDLQRLLRERVVHEQNAGLTGCIHYQSSILCRAGHTPSQRRTKSVPGPVVHGWARAAPLANTALPGSPTNRWGSSPRGMKPDATNG